MSHQKQRKKEKGCYLINYKMYGQEGFSSRNTRCRVEAISEVQSSEVPVNSSKESWEYRR